MHQHSPVPRAYARHSAESISDLSATISASQLRRLQLVPRALAATCIQLKEQAPSDARLAARPLSLEPLFVNLKR